MYPVTNEFKLAAKRPVQEHRLYGTIGSVSFDKSNIIQGSFHITNQCTDTNDVVLGSVYTGTLTATFTGLSIPRYAWIGKRITVYFGLKVTPTTWEDIPMGIFTVKEAKHSAEGVSVTAYDDMIKLDKKFKKSKFKEPAKIYNFLTTICNTCGLILEDSEQTIQSRPNGDTLLGIVGTKSNSKLAKYANDIETYRDLVFWIAQSMACFATINKLGHLMFVPYRNESNVVDEITEEHRIAGAVFDDFTTNYTGIYVTNTADGEEIYYGYDEQELEQEIATVEGDIHDVEIALDQLAQQYQQGQITEAEYKRQKKILDKQLKNLTKRLAWLNEALDKARSEEDGLYMDLGENPMMQADGVGNTPTTMRKRILKALDAISYTPFTCDTVCGAHYDLGDIIRFTGGHATELGEVCCVMAYDFNMNGEYRMQGFGSDPSKGVMKSKNSKKADKANRNADSSAKNITGNTTPTSGNDGDLHIQYEGEHEAEITCGGGFRIDSITGDYKSGYNIDITFSNDMSMEALYLKYTGLTANTEYTFACQMQIDTNSLAYYNNQSGFSICVSDQKLWNTDGMGIPYGQAHGGEITEVENPRAVAQSMYYDTNWHDYRINFKPVGEECYVIFTYTYLQSTFGGRHVETHVKDMIFTGADLPTIDKVNIEGEWKNLDYVKKVKQVQTSSGGTKIATAQNSDGSTTDIYAPTVTIPVEDVKVDGTSVVTSKVANINTMTGADASNAGTKGLVPAPAAGDNQKFLCGDGTFKTVSGGGSITPNPPGTATANLEKVTIESTIYAIKDTNAVHSTDKGVANGVASLDANGKVPTAQIPSLDSTYLPLAGGEMTGRIDTYAPPSDIMPAIMPKTAFYGSVGFSNKPYRFGFFQGAVLGASYEEAGTSKMGTLSMYTGLGAYAAVIKPDPSQSASEVDLVLPKTSGTLALTSEIPTKTSDLTNDSGFVTTDEKVTQENTTTNASKRVLLSDSANDTTETSIALKSSKLTFNPSNGLLSTEYIKGSFENHIITTTDYCRVVIALCKVSTNDKQGSTSHSSGVLVHLRSNGTIPAYQTYFTFQDDYYGAKNCHYSLFTDYKENTNTTIGNADGVRACIFTYNGEYYAGIESYYVASHKIRWYGERDGDTSFSPFAISYYKHSTQEVLNSEIFNSITFTTGLNRYDFTIDRAKKNASGVAFGDLATINKGSGSSKFLREDGTWQTVTASWSGGQVTSDIYPNATGTLKVGKVSRYFSESYVRTAYVNTCVVGYDGEVTGSLYLSRAEGYSAIITAPVLSANVALTLPGASGTLVTDSYLNSNFLWKGVGSAVSGNTEIALPSGWTELLVIVGTTLTTGNRECFSVHIHGSSCSSNANNFFYSGAYFTSTVNNGIQLKMTNKSKIQLSTAYYNGSSIINNLSTAVYYK